MGKVKTTGNILVIQFAVGINKKVCSLQSIFKDICLDKATGEMKEYNFVDGFLNATTPSLWLEVLFYRIFTNLWNDSYTTVL